MMQRVTPKTPTKATQIIKRDCDVQKFILANHLTASAEPTATYEALCASELQFQYYDEKDAPPLSSYIRKDLSETCLVVAMIWRGVYPCRNMKVQKPARPE